MAYTFSPRAARRILWSAFLLGLALLGNDLLSAQEGAKAPARKLPRGRLPAHYAEVVAPDQKERIYEIQESYAPRIKELRAQLVALQAERDAKCRALLNAEQQKKLDELIAAAKSARTAEDAAAKATPATAATPPAAAVAPVPAKKPLAKSGSN